MFDNDFFNRGLAGAMVHESRQTTLERVATAEAMADAKAQVARTQLMPQLFARDTAFSPALLKSALFRSTERGPRSLFASLPLESADGDAITYSGEELRQDDQAVLLALIKLASGQSVTEGLQFGPRSFARNVLGWPDKGGSVERLGECLRRLKGACVKVRYAKGGEGTLSFVSDYEMQAGSWTVWLAPRLLNLFAKQTTYLNVESRKGLSGLTSWLFGFVNADPCVKVFELEALHSLSGSPSNGRVFVRALQESLEELQAVGLVQSFEVKKGRVRITRASSR